MYLALSNNFTAIDTAAQPRHYREDLVCAGIARAIAEHKISRSQLFFQTKFTQPAGQDPNDMPYDASSPIAEQIHASVRSSLANLRQCHAEGEGEPYIDSLVLHSPFRAPADNLLAWRTLETYVPNTIRHLGLSNTTLPFLEHIYAASDVKPSIVQNRFYPATGFDVPLRAFCREHGIVYQSFWTLTANPELMRGKDVAALASEVGISRHGALYALVLGLEWTCILDGTKSEEHMREDWEALEKVKIWALEDEERWKRTMERFKRTIGE